MQHQWRHEYTAKGRGYILSAKCTKLLRHHFFAIVGAVCGFTNISSWIVSRAPLPLGGGYQSRVTLISLTLRINYYSRETNRAKDRICVRRTCEPEGTNLNAAFDYRTKYSIKCIHQSLQYILDYINPSCFLAFLHDKTSNHSATDSNSRLSTYWNIKMDMHSHVSLFLKYKDLSPYQVSRDLQNITIKYTSTFN